MEGNIGESCLEFWRLHTSLDAIDVLGHRKSERVKVIILHSFPFFSSQLAFINVNDLFKSYKYEDIIVLKNKTYVYSVME